MGQTRLNKSLDQAATALMILQRSTVRLSAYARADHVVEEGAEDVALQPNRHHLRRAVCVSSRAVVMAVPGGVD